MSYHYKYENIDLFEVINEKRSVGKLSRWFRVRKWRDIPSPNDVCNGAEVKEWVIIINMKI